MTNLKSANSAQIFNFVIDSFERKQDLSEISLLSKHRGSEIVDARMSFYKILKSVFGMGFSSIGKIFGKDHSTIIYAINRHDDLLNRDKAYTKNYLDILNDITFRLEAYNCSPVRNGKMKIKTLHSSELSSFDIVLNCFDDLASSVDYIKRNGIRSENIIYCGQPILMTDEIAKDIVYGDEKKYLLDKAKAKSLADINNLSKNFYDYRTGEFIMEKDPVSSFISATTFFEKNTISLVYMQPIIGLLNLQAKAL